MILREYWANNQVKELPKDTQYFDKAHSNHLDLEVFNLSNII